MVVVGFHEGAFNDKIVFEGVVRFGVGDELYFLFRGLSE